MGGPGRAPQSPRAARPGGAVALRERGGPRLGRHAPALRAPAEPWRSAVRSDAGPRRGPVLLGVGSVLTERDAPLDRALLGADWARCERLWVSVRMKTWWMTSRAGGGHDRWLASVAPSAARSRWRRRCAAGGR